MGTVCSLGIKDVFADDVVEKDVCSSDYVEEGQLKEVDIEGHTLVLLRERGQVRAFSGLCPHYKAPLNKAALDPGIIRCSWHGACFDSVTGDIEDFPGVDSLARFEVEESDGVVKVRASKALLREGKRQRPVCKMTEDAGKVVVIGGGGAGFNVVKTLREEGYGGPVSLISAEHCLPYDRPRLSKVFRVEHKDIELRDAAWYESAEIEVLLDKEIISIDASEKFVITRQGDKIEYSNLVLAVGSKPKELGVPGENLKGVTGLRSIDQLENIYSNIAGEGKHVVIIGSSYIGMEVAGLVVDKVEMVTVVGRDSFPFRKSLGEKIGKVVMKIHKERGIQFRMLEEVVEFIGAEGAVEKVKLKNSEDIKADLVIIAVGVDPRSEIYSAIPGLDLDSCGRIMVDKSMATSVPGIWAAGDIVNFPLPMYGDQRVSIGHWGVAMYLGRQAALSIMGRSAELNTIPFYWTVQCGYSIRFAGHPDGFDDIVMRHQKEDRKICAFYCKDDHVLAVATLNRDPVAAQFANLRRSGRQLRKADALSWAESF